MLFLILSGCSSPVRDDPCPSIFRFARRMSLASGVLALALLLTFGMSACGQSAQLSATPLPRASAPPATTLANLQVSGTSTPDHVEPAIAVNPQQPQNLLAAAMFLSSPDQPPFPGTFTSNDGGRTWQENGSLPLPAGYSFGYDVTVAFNAAGTGFVCAVAEDGQPAVSGVFIWRTDDGGSTFAPPVAVTTGGHGADHPWLAVDTLPGQNQNALYVAWSDTTTRQILFSRSGDGRGSFSAPLVLSSTDAPPVVVVGPAGTVHVFGALEVVNSSDGGRSFEAPEPIPAAQQTEGTDRKLPPNMDTLLAAASDPQDGSLYVALAGVAPGAGHLDILLWRSQDGGHTWATPVSVTNDPLAGKADYFQPQVAVGPTGTVMVSYFALTHGQIDIFLAQSTTHGARFQPSQRVNAASFTPTSDLKEQGYRYLKGHLIGDYQGLAIGPDVAYPCWTDTHTGHLAIFTARVPTSSSTLPA